MDDTYFLEGRPACLTLHPRPQKLMAQPERHGLTRSRIDPRSRGTPEPAPCRRCPQAVIGTRILSLAGAKATRPGTRPVRGDEEVRWLSREQVPDLRFTLLDRPRRLETENRFVIPCSGSSGWGVGSAGLVAQLRCGGAVEGFADDVGVARVLRGLPD